MIIDLREKINEFDREHIVKQIILIGSDGVTRNIEFELTDEEEDGN